MRDLKSFKGLELRSFRTLAAVAVVVVAVIAGGAYVALDSDFIPELNQNGDEDSQEEENGLIGATTASQIEGDIIDVTLGDGTQAEPFRPTISPEDGIRFNNVAEHDLLVTFQRSGFEDVVVEAGGSVVVDVDRMVDYEADTVDEEITFRAIPGSVNVQ